MSSSGSPVVPVLKRWQLRLATVFAVLSAVLTLGNVVISRINKGIERRGAEVHARNQADQALISQTQDATRRVMLYLRNAGLRLDQAASADPEFGALLRRQDTGRAFARLQEMMRQAKDAPASGSSTAAPQ